MSCWDSLNIHFSTVFTEMVGGSRLLNQRNSEQLCLSCYSDQANWLFKVMRVSIYCCYCCFTWWQLTLSFYHCFLQTLYLLQWIFICVGIVLDEGTGIFKPHYTKLTLVNICVEFFHHCVLWLESFEEVLQKSQFWVEFKKYNSAITLYFSLKVNFVSSENSLIHPSLCTLAWKLWGGTAKKGNFFVSSSN
jgi:hypothetical protein